MKESKKISKLESIRLIYNEKTMRIVAELTTSVDGVKVPSRIISNFEDINSLIASFSRQNKKTVSELVNKGLITVDEKLINGVIVLDNNKEYQKYIFNVDTGLFDQTRLTRIEKKALGILNSYDTDEPTTVVEEPTRTVAEPVEEVEARPVHMDVNTDMIVLWQLSERMQRLNPSADIRIGRVGLVGTSSYQIYSSAPVETLILPEGFYREVEDYGWITNGHVSFLIKDLALVDERMLVPSIREYMFGEPEVSHEEAERDSETRTDSETHDDSEIHTDREVHVDSEDGAVEVTADEPVSEPVEEEEEVVTGGIRNLRINRRALKALLLAGGILLVGSLITTYIHKNNRKVSISTKTRTEQQTKNDPVLSTAETSFNTDETIYAGTSQNNGTEANIGVPFEYTDMSLQIQTINDMCIPYKSCDFEYFVDENDRDAIRVIGAARNAAVSDRSRVYALLSDYMDYIFGGSNTFDNNVIKGYDYLNPFSKYVVLVSGETMLQLGSDYGFLNENIISMYDERINDVTSELLTKGRGY